jgi:hypothetical protein
MKQLLIEKGHYWGHLGFYGEEEMFINVRGYTRRLANFMGY